MFFKKHPEKRTKYSPTRKYKLYQMKALIKMIEERFQVIHEKPQHGERCLDDIEEIFFEIALRLD